MSSLLPSDPWRGPADPWTRSPWSTADITYAGRAAWETWLALFIAFFLVVSNLALGIPSVNAVVPTALDDAYTVPEGGSLGTVGGTWHLPDWRLRRSITFNNTGRGQLDNFPVLIKLDPSDIDYTRTQGLGQDLRFVDSDGTPLAYEIEEWNTAGSYVWVKVPQIDAGSTTDYIWMYYDNGSVGDAQNPGAVWSNGYVGVWHMDQNPGASQILDSTSYLNHGTASSMDLTNLQAGRVGDGLYFDGSAAPNSDYIRVPSDGADELSISGASPQLTLEAWVRRTGAPTNEWMVVVGRQVGIDFYDSYTLATVYNAPDVASFVTSNGASTDRVDSAAAAVPFDEWRYLTAVRNGNNMFVYSNGSQVGTGTAAVALATDNNDVTIGAQENDATAVPDESWRGVLDEIRISNIPRSADWVNAQHASMTDTFGAYGLQEEAGVLANDSDPESDPMTAVLAAGPSHAATFSLNPDGSFTYTPVVGMSGTDSFTYVANDGTGDSNVATVTITVTPTGPNTPPDAVDDPAAATTQDTLVVIDVLTNDTDPDPDTLTVSAVTQGANGAVVNNGTDVTYTPNASWTGVDTFTYEASDGNGGFDTATVTVTVSAAANNPPVAVDDSDSTVVDTAVVVDVLANDSDPDLDPLTVNSVTQGTNGSVVNNVTDVTYTPNASWTGVDTFTYEASDGNGGFDTATVTVTVAANNPPVAVDDSDSTVVDTAVVVDVLANDSDPDLDPLTVNSVTQGTNGSVVNNVTDVTYTPNASWTGVDTFTYEASDGNGGTDTATVTVTVLEPVVLNQIQKGTATLAGGFSSTTATISAVDLTKSLLVFSVRENLGNPRDGLVTGQLTNATTVTFQRVGTTGSVTIEWSVVEFTSGVTVQRGSTSMTATTMNVPISAVDLTRSFPIVSQRVTGTVFSDDDFIDASLTATDNLQLRTGGFNSPHVAEWQVVQYNQAAVQTGTVSFGSAASSQTATIDAVDTAKSWLIYGTDTTVGTSSNIGQELVRGIVTNATTLTFDRGSTGQTMDATWYLVEFQDATEVQHANVAFASTDTTKDVTITSVDPARSIAVGGYQMTGGRSPYTGNDVPGVAWFTLDLTSNTNLRVQRDAALDTADLGWFVIHWPGLTYTVSGTVFEDIAADVLNDGAVGDASNPGAVGVDVYLYEDTNSNSVLNVGTDTLVAGPVATDASGNYSFSGLTDLTDYFVRVASKTVPSSQDVGALQGDLWAEQTYAPAGTWCANGSGSASQLVADGPCYGGLNAALSDSAAFPEHFTMVSISGASVSGVDYGFSHNVVVNTRAGDTADDDLGANRTVQGSLRQFIQNAVAISGPNPMRFVPAVPANATDGGGNSWWNVPVTLALPAVSGAGTIIDGTAYQLSDGSTLRNTNALGPELELNGSGTPANTDGLLVTGGTSTVRDLVINRFTRNGILVTTAGSNTIAGNYLGTDATGTSDLGNGNDGIRILSVPSNTIGGLNPGDRNVISGNNNNGLLIDGVAASGNVIQGNYVGLNALGTAGIGNTDDGVDLSDTPGNTVGGTDPAARNVIGGQGDVGLLFVGAQTTGNVAINNYIGTNAAGDAGVPNGTGASAYNGAAGNRIGGINANEANLIAFNTGDGVWIQATAGVNNAVLRNSIHTNGGLGIDTEADGVHITTPGDPLNFPVITSATETAGTVDVDFNLDVPDGNYRVEFFTNTVADGSGNGEGETFVSSVDVSVTAGVPTPGSHSFAGSDGDILSATATGGTAAPFGPTSEFSAAVTVTPGVFVVNSTGNVGDNNPGNGVCYTGANNTQGQPACTLRAAIEEANALAGDDVIEFNMPATEAGHSGGVWTITLSTALPSISTTITLDARTQTGWTGNPVVALDGASTTSATGLSLSGTADGSTVAGLRVVGFDVDGVFVAPGAVGVTIADNWIGSDGSGSSLVGNGDDGIDLWGINAVIDGNVVNHNTDEGIDVRASGATITGNIIGLEADGSSGTGNGDVGIAVFSDNTTIGSPTAGDRNVISANFEGIEINSSNNTVQGNYIGVDATGSGARGNDSDNGVEIQSGTGNLVGGTAAGEGNVIAYNQLDGVRLAGGNDNAVLGNTIYGNGGLGIDLGTNGPTPNDAGDPDSGANDLLNYPVITSATDTAGTISLDFDLDVPAGDYRIEFFDNTAADVPTGYGEGETFVDFYDVVGHPGGSASYSTSFAGSAGDILTATTTENLGATYGSTSEFSAAYTATAANGQPVFNQDLIDRSDPEGTLISLSAAATDPETDPLVYSATGLPLGLSIDSGTGLITGLVNHAAAASSPYSVEISVTDSINPPVTDTFTWTVTNVPATIPYVVAGTGGANGGDDLLTNVDETDFAPATNEVDIGTGTGTNSIEAIATHPTSGVVYAVNGGQFGSLNADSGVFTPIGTGLGTAAAGVFGPVLLDDVRGLAFHPLNDRLYGVERRAGEDVLFQIDVGTGSHIVGAFGVDDYRRVKSLGSLDDVTDLAVDPIDWEMYAVMTDGGTYQLATVKRQNGNTKGVGALTASIAGLDFTAAGQMWGTDAGALYTINKTSGGLDAGRTLDNGSNYGALAFGVNPALPPSLEGTVFEDLDGNALGIAESPDDVDNPGVAGVGVHLYRDLGVVGVPEGSAVDTWYASTVTGPTGHYFFSEIPVGPFWIVVDSTTINPVAGGTGWAEQTYAPPGGVVDAAYTIDPVAGPLFGGMQPTASDDFSGSGLTAAEHLAHHTFVAAEVVEDIDFGFSFNVVTNVAGGDGTSPQGSLRQFTTNANNGTGPNVMRFVPVVPTNASQVLDQWWSIPVTVVLPALSDAGTTVDGTAYDPADGTTVLDTNSLGPELELNGTGTAATEDGLLITGGTATISDLVINRFGRDGIRITTAGDNIITGDYLGTDATGTVDRGNANDGIRILSAPGNTIGGLSSALRNVISGNDNNGVLIDGAASTGNIIQGNYVGLNAAGTAAIGNTDDGVDLSDAPGNTVGGSDPLARNVISGQGDVGLLLIGNSTGNTVQGNYVGTNAAGDAPLPNGTGIHLSTFAGSNTVGGTAADAGNLVSGNTGVGIQVDTNGNTVQGNTVGADAAGTGPLPNGTEGIALDAGASGNLIGGIAAGTANQIAYNSSDGVDLKVGAGSGNAILGNTILANSGMGIDIAPNGVNLNDVIPGDPDSGPNDLLNFPVITSAVEVAGTVTLDFDLDVPDGDYRIEFFTNTAADPTGYGEGETLVHAFNVVGHLSGSASYSTSFAGSAGDVVTATATEETAVPFGSTSEFSAAYTCTSPNQPPVLDLVGNQSGDELVLLTFTATASDPDGDGYSFSLSGEPAGASIDPLTGVFSWIPSEAQGPNIYTFDIVVTDDGIPVLDDSETITVTVDEVNVAPVLGAVGDQTVDEQTPLTFTATATDADLPANTLSFSLSGEPAGASIDPVTGVFSWTPSEAQGPNIYTFDIVVTDDGIPVLDDSETITVTVAEVNVAPVLGAVGDQTVDEQTLLTFTASATDADLPANTLSFSLSGEPAGASIDPVTGVFSWTPSEAQGPNIYTFDVVVTDNGVPVLNYSETITVTVNEINVAPVLGAVGDQTTDEQTLLTFTASATDADLPANTLSFSLSGEPAGALVNPLTGVFTWTPSEAQGPNSYTFDVNVSDGVGGVDSETITVTVNEVNIPPVLGAVGDQSVDEQTLLTFTASATDVDLPANTLTFSLSGEPVGASVNPLTGVFSWTPSEAQGPNSYTFDVVVTDGTTPDSETITVTVNEVNVAPVVTNPGDQTDTEGTVVNLPITATDADLPANGLSYGAAGLPPNLTIDPVSGLISGTVAFGCNAGSPYAVTVTVTDDGLPNLQGQASFDWYCPNTNRPPVLDPVGNQSGDELVLLSFTATASDPDLDGLLFSLSGEPAGASINPLTGVFTWTPTEAQGPNTYTFDIVVTDDGTPNLNDSETITITVNEVNVAPVLAAIGNQTVDEQTLLTFSASTTDADVPANGLLFSLSGEPAGASIDPNSGVFTWTPTEAQGPGSYTFSVVVTDNGTPNLVDSESITVTVDEVNVAPVLAAIGGQTVDEQTLLTFTASATDADVPANGLLFSLVGEPAGASIDPNSGVFTWTPTEAQGPGSYTFSVVVTDNGTPNLADSESITVTVNEVNVAPVLAGIGNQTVDEQTLLTFTASATDADLPANGLLFSLSGEPAGALIDPNTGVFTWTPTEAQGPGSYTFDVNVVDGAGGSDSETITVTVNEVNVAPVLNPVGPQGGGEGSPVTFTASAVDPDIPTTLSFTLVDGPVDAVPAGASIGLLSGVFSWTPSETQGPGVYEFYIRVTDNTALFDQELVTFTITEANVPPVLAAIGNQTVDELVLLTFTASATDADLPANTLTFGLSGEPAGASIDPVTGEFSWTPSEAQGPGSYTFDVVVTDDGTPVLNDSESITVTVNEVNVAPVLAAIGNQTVDEQTPLTFTASATDADVPANGLLFSLSGEPAGASIDPNSGVFTWTPTEAQGPGSYTFSVVVTDNGTPNLSDSESITVTVGEVNVAPVLAGIGNQTVDEQTLLTFTASATDADVPANSLLFGLVGEPAGASIDPNSGVFTWTPTEAQGPGSYTFSVVVTDNGTPNLADSESITVTVNEVNVPPVLAAIGNHTVDEQTLLTFTASATDADLPANGLLFSLSGEPAGALIDPVSGVFTWTPAESQGPGSYTFAVNVVDGVGGSDSETITVTVNEVNVAPVLGAVGDQTVDEQTLLTFTATATDSDLPANGLTFSLAGEPAGAFIDPVSGVFAWTPSETQGPGVFTLDVAVADGGVPAGSDSETITITVNEVNAAPVLTNPGGQTSTENDLVNLTIPGVDADVPANTLNWSAVGLPDGLAIGPLTGVISGTISYDASAGSPHVVTVTATDNGIPNLADSVVFGWTVIDLNRPPLAADDAGSVAEDLIVTIDVLANDSDPDLDALTVSGVTQGVRGSVTNNGTDVTYMPDLNWNGTDTFTYTATDGRGGFDTASVTVVVTPVNDNPVASPDSGSGLEDGALVVAVLTNDTDIDGDSLAVTSVTPGTNGSVTTDGTTVTYQPVANWNGTDSFTYTVADGNGGFDTGAVTVTVAPVNDAPVAVNDAMTLNEDGSGSVSVLANDSDVDGDPLNLVGYTNPAYGTVAHLGGGVFVYSPDPNFFGADTFTYTVGDGTLSAGATVTVTVVSVNDAPVAAADNYSMVGDTVLNTDLAGLPGVLANDTDVEGGPLTAVIDSGPSNGTIALSPDGSFVYTPDIGWFGTDSFIYHASDGVAGSAPVTVQVVVDRPNQAPAAVNDQYSVGEGDTLVVGAPGVLGNDSDPDADLLTAVLVSRPGRGTLTLAANGSFVYTHTAENAVDDSFTYVATDSRGATSLAVVIIRVIENLAPVVVADLISIDEDTVGNVDALANDLDPEGVSLAIVGIEQPLNGVVTLEADGTLSFAPALNWFGTTQFAYLAGDGRKSSRAVVTVVVAAVNDLPVGGRDSYRFTQYGPATLNVLANDTDVDGDALSVISINGVEHALVDVVGGALVYNAHPEWLGTETFTYTLSDGHGGETDVLVGVTMADEALEAANSLAGEVGAPDVPFDSPDASPAAPSISLGSPEGVSLLAGAFFDSFEALRLPLGFLLIALLWALIFGGLFSSPWFLFGGRRRFWSIVLVDRESMVPVHDRPDFESATVYNYPPTTQNITSTGAPKRNGNTVWMPVDTPNGEGWIDAYYLTQEIDDQTFANDKRPAELAAKFVAALTAGNHRAMAKLVSARGLAAVRFGKPVVVPLNRLKTLLSTDKEPGWWRADTLTAMEALFPERLAEPFLSSYWAGSHPEKPGKVATLLVPAEVRNFHRFTYSNAEGTWWLLFEYHKRKLTIAGIALAE